MGLPERKALFEYENNVFPKWQKKLDEALGYHLEIEVDWSSLGEEGQAANFERGFDALYFEPLVLAIEEIGADDFGKKALKDGLAKYVVSGKDPEDRIYYKLANKTLSYSHDLSNVDYVDDRKKQLIDLFNKSL